MLAPSELDLLAHAVQRTPSFPAWQRYDHLLPIWQDERILPTVVYGRILRQLRESKGRLQAEVARSVGISPAQLARLEANQRGLYVEDFVRIAEALGEKPGNLLSNDVGDIGHLKPLIDRLAAVRPEFLPRVATIIEKLVLLTEDMTAAKRLPERKQDGKPQRKSKPAPQRKGRR
jgi:transcriptional regulator with XRE-family HTH domain